MGDHAEPAAGLRHQIVTYADPRQGGLFDTYSHPGEGTLRARRPDGPATISAGRAARVARGGGLHDRRRRAAGTGPVLPGGPAADGDPVQVRRFRLDVANGYDRPYVEFGDADHGVRAFRLLRWEAARVGLPGAAPRHRGRRAVRHRVPHPRPLAGEQRLQVTADVPILHAGGDGWYFSLDDGGSFQFERGVSPPSVVRALQSWIQLDDRTGKMIGWHGGVW